MLTGHFGQLHPPGASLCDFDCFNFGSRLRAPWPTPALKIQVRAEETGSKTTLGGRLQDSASEVCLMIDCRHSPTLHSCFWAGEPGPAVLQSTELPDQRLLRVDGDTVQPTPALGGLVVVSQGGTHAGTGEKLDLLNVVARKTASSVRCTTAPPDGGRL